MIIPSFRLYHFAVKLIWKRMLVLTLLFWLGGSRSVLCGKQGSHVAGVWLLAAFDGGWHLFSIYGRKVDADDDAT